MHTKNLQYPSGIGHTLKQPFMVLTSYESRNAIESVGQTYKTKTTEVSPGISISSIALYIPHSSLRQTTDANWSEVEGGALRAGALSAMGNITGLAGGIEGAGDTVTEMIGNIAKSVGMGGFQAAAKQLDKTTGMLSAGAGIAVNNHMAMAYKGPGKFRTHEFAFQFFPKNEDDAKDIFDIITDFQNGMLPRMAGEELKTSRTLSRPFFRSPRHWDIEFFKGDGDPNPFLFEIKKSVITNMVVNHDPNSTVSFHYDGSPVQTNFSLTFQEIEFPTSLDGKSALDVAKAEKKFSVTKKIHKLTKEEGEDIFTG